MNQLPQLTPRRFRYKYLVLIGVAAHIILIIGHSVHTLRRLKRHEKTLKKLEIAHERTHRQLALIVHQEDKKHEETVGSENNRRCFGIDISRWNGKTFLGASDSISFAICKATQGIGYTDPNYQTNRQFIKQKGWFCGAYHFYIPGENPELQAEHFWRVIVVSRYKVPDIPLIVDVERSASSGNKTDLIEFQVNLFRFLNRLEKLSKRKPMIYCSSWFGNTYLTHPSFGEYPLWIADYTDQLQPEIPTVWKQKGFKIWQKSDHYSIESHLTDFDVHYGNLQSLIQD